MCFTRTSAPWLRFAGVRRSWVEGQRAVRGLESFRSPLLAKANGTETTMVLAAAVIASLIVGFLAGLLSFKQSEQFCPTHGVTKTCSLCLRGGAVRSVRS